MIIGIIMMTSITMKTEMRIIKAIGITGGGILTDVIYCLLDVYLITLN